VIFGEGIGNYLHVICNNPIFTLRIAKDCVLAVNLSTTNQAIDYDKSCLLLRTDHPFITHDSYVFYRKAKILGVDSISRNIADDTFSTHQLFNDAIFEKILSGFSISISKEVKPKIKAF